MQPIVSREVPGQHCGRFVTGPGQVKKRFTTTSKLLFGLIDLPSRKHHAVQLE
jgi:hypothetical protein